MMHGNTMSTVTWHANEGERMTVAGLRGFLAMLDTTDSMSGVEFDNSVPKVRIDTRGRVKSISVDGTRIKDGE